MSVSLYLRALGWELDDVPFAEWAGARRELHARFRRCMTNAPRHPVARGKFSGHLWDALPEERRLPGGEGEARTILRDHPAWTLLTDRPGDGVWRLSGEVEGEWPRCDLYLLAATGETLVVDHEDMGPWLLRPGERWGRLERATAAPEPLPGEPLAPADARRHRRLLLRRLRRQGFHVPKHPLEPAGRFRDHLWNYLPQAHDAPLGPGSFAREVVLGAGAVIVSDDLGNAARLVGARAEDLEGRAARYFADPALRWLLAVPGERDREDFEPSFVLLSE